MEIEEDSDRNMYLKKVEVKLKLEQWEIGGSENREVSVAVKMVNRVRVGVWKWVRPISSMNRSFLTVADENGNSIINNNINNQNLFIS
jgi:hypothetical protein